MSTAECTLRERDPVVVAEAKHRLVLVRHAKSDYPLGVVDHDRPLNARGRRDAPFIGSWIRDHVPWPEAAPPLILVSSAMRAQLTWALARAGLDDRWRADLHRDEPRIYDASADGVSRVIGEIDEDVHTTVVVGHNPAMRDVVEQACVAGELRDEATLKYPTSAVAVLATVGPWAGILEGRPQFEIEAFTIPRAPSVPRA